MIVNPSKDARHCEFCGKGMREWLKGGQSVRYYCGTWRHEYVSISNCATLHTRIVTKRSRKCRRGEVARLAERVAALEAQAEADDE